MIKDLGMIIVAAGASRRFGGGSKLMEMLGDKPLFLHSVMRFAPYAAPGALVLVIPAGDDGEFRRILAGYAPGLQLKLVPGGDTRNQSVRNGFQALPEGVRTVAVHDAARPFASVELLEELVRKAEDVGGAIPGFPVADSLRRRDENGMMAEIVDRNALYAVATPQVFRVEEFRTAAGYPGNQDCTDDAEMMQRAGFPVALVESREFNLKVTTRADLELMRLRLSAVQQ